MSDERKPIAEVIRMPHEEPELYLAMLNVSSETNPPQS